ncbi:MAG: isochorismatase family cysteine hydrolase [Acidobacteriota bacterium]|nr:cysteine hydrolase [Blastocatellia bacterium]MDW8413141.1 isochorismatase family cysteine hydrolase [Acidobacteriota bacterium]
MKLAFVDIDTQVDFMLPEGALYVPGAETLIPNLERLIAYARDNGIPVIASVDAHLIGDPEFEQFPPHCVVNTPGQQKVSSTGIAGAQTIGVQKVPDLQVGNALVLEKTVFSIFGNENADEVFRQIKADEYVVFGVATDYCVKAAVLGLIERGYKVAVVEDAIKGVTEQGALEAIEEMRRAGARFVTTEQVIANEK